MAGGVVDDAYRDAWRASLCRFPRIVDTYSVWTPLPSAQLSWDIALEPHPLSNEELSNDRRLTATHELTTGENRKPLSTDVYNAPMRRVMLWLVVSR